MDGRPMLLHLRPRLLLPYSRLPAELVDLRIDPPGLHLRGGVDVIARRPYPNRRYLVACRKAGRRAVDGLLAEAGRWRSEFRYIARWAVDAQFVVTHDVTLTLLDAEFDLASDSMALFRDRRHPELHRRPPAEAEPTMTVVRPGDVVRQRFSIPTIVRGSFASAKACDRLVVSHEWTAPPAQGVEDDVGRSGCSHVSGLSTRC